MHCKPERRLRVAGDDEVALAARHPRPRHSHSHSKKSKKVEKTWQVFGWGSVKTRLSVLFKIQTLRLIGHP
jgi:hypothetical protein